MYYEIDCRSESFTFPSTFARAFLENRTHTDYCATLWPTTTCGVIMISTLTAPKCTLHMYAHKQPMWALRWCGVSTASQNESKEKSISVRYSTEQFNSRTQSAHKYMATAHMLTFGALEARQTHIFVIVYRCWCRGKSRRQVERCTA